MGSEPGQFGVQHRGVPLDHAVAAGGVVGEQVGEPQPAGEVEAGLHRLADGWQGSTVRAILENPRYTGYAFFGRWTRREVLQTAAAGSLVSALSIPGARAHGTTAAISARNTSRFVRFFLVA